MIAIKLSDKVMARMPQYCDDCYYYGTLPHPYKGWTEVCELCKQCMDDDQEEGWVYDGNGRPANCPLVEVPNKQEKDEVME